MDRGAAAALLREMVAIPSFSGEEGGVADLIAARLAEWGIGTTRIGNNLVAACMNAPGRPVLLLDAHIDTVKVCRGYTFDPFNPPFDGEVIRGLGANDDGGSVVSMAAAFHSLAAEKFPCNLILALTAEEENSGEGGAASLYAPDGGLASAGLPSPDMAIVGEPTGMMAATSERGLIVIDAEASGVSGHAARGEGENALYKALEDISRIRSYKFGKVSPRNGEVRTAVTVISGGSLHNVVPDSCRFTIDVRPNECYANAEIVELLQGICESRLTPRSLRHRSNSTPEGSPLLAAVRGLGIGEYPSPTTSNWINIPCPAIKMGPGDSARSHRPDEYITVAEIGEATEGYISFIKELYGNTLE